MTRRREMAAALFVQKHYRGRLVRRTFTAIPSLSPSSEPEPEPEPESSPSPGPIPSSGPSFHPQPNTGQMRQMFRVITELTVFVQVHRLGQGQG